MKKTGKIVLFVIPAVVLLLAVFHSAIISFTLKKIISERSNGKIALNVDEFHLRLFPGDITIIHPALKFKDLYLNESKSLKVEEISFKNMTIEDIDLISLIFKREIDARRFYVDKPEFHIFENGTKNKVDFQPKGFFDALKHEDQSFADLYLNIDNIEIHYGSITFSNSIDIGIDPGQVDFTINLKGFSTHHDSLEKERFLYSDEFSFKIRNVHKVLNSGYDLDIDSVTFNSAHRDFVINGINFSPLDILKKENTIKFTASEISINDIGLDELREQRGIDLGSIKFSKVELTSFLNKKNKSIAGEDSLKKQGIDKIIKVFNNFSIDTIALSEFNYFVIDHQSDTLISATDVNVMLTELLLDSTMYSDIAKRIGFEEIALNTGAVKLSKAITGFEISYEEFSYANVDDELEIHGLKVYGEKNGNVIDVETPEIRLYGLSAHKLQKLHRQNMSVYINDPSGTITLGNSVIQPDTIKRSFALPFNLNFYEISVNNGDFKLKKDSVFKTNIKGLNIFAGGVEIPVALKDSLKMQEFNISSDTINAFIDKGRMNIGVSGIDYENDNFILSNLKLEQVVENDTNNINIRSVELIDLNRDSLLYAKKICLDSLLLVSPLFEGKLITRSNIDTGKVLISLLSADVQNVAVRNGRVNAVLKIKDEPVDMSADYDLLAGPFVFSKGDTLKITKNMPDWEAGLNNINIHTYGHHVYVKRLKSDTKKSLFSLEDLEISSDKKFGEHPAGLNIRFMRIPLLKVAGLNYGKLISNDTVMLSSITLQSPEADIILKKNNESIADKKEFDINSLNAILYDTVRINDLSFRVNRRGENLNRIMAVKNLNFAHFNKNIGSGNLIKEIIMKVGELDTYDSLTHKSFIVNDLELDTAKCILSAGNIKSGVHLNDSLEQKGVKVFLNGIRLSEINISDSLPVNISASLLKVTDVDVFITNDSVKREDKSKVMGINLKGLRNYKDLFASLQIDTVDLSDVNFRIHALGDLPVKTARFDSLGLIIEKVRIDSSMAYMANPSIMDRINIDLNGKTNVTADSLYEMRPGILHYSFLSQKITIDSFYVTPLFPPDEFFRRAGYQTDRFDVFVRKIEINDFGFDDLMEDNTLDLRSVNLYDLKADIFRDKHYPMKPGIIKPMPREMIMGIKRSFNIDSVHVFNSYLRYREMSEKSTDAGEVFFDKVNLSVHTITNILNDNNKKEMNVRFQSMIMGKGEMNLNITFPLNKDSVAYRLSGNTKRMDLTLLNPLTTNLLGIGIIKGKGSVDIKQIVGTNELATGNLIFRYKQLRLHPYSRKKEKLKKGPLSPIIKFMINDLVVKSNNPRFARKPRVGQVYFERDNQKGIVNYLWKGVLSGLASTMGFNNREQRKEKKENKSAIKQAADIIGRELKPESVKK